MNIAVAVTDKKIARHFGHCEVFALFTVDDASGIRKSRDMVPPPHEPGRLPQWLKQIGASVVLAGGMGQRAQDLCRTYQIEPVCGLPPWDPEEAVQSYLNGKLTAGENPCDH